MEECLQFRCPFRNCAGEDFFEFFEFQHGPVGPLDFVSTVTEEEQPRRTRYHTLHALVSGVRQETHWTTRGRQRLHLAALFSCTADQNGWRVPGGRIAQLSRLAVVDAVPDGEVKTVLTFHLEDLIQRG